MLSMGNELALEIIAEGIESEEQTNFLRAKGCQGGQGYLYGKPGPAVRFARTRKRENPAIRLGKNRC